jgi:hypothetical protein
MRESHKNMAASIQARLKRQAESQGKPFAELLQLPHTIGGCQTAAFEELSKRINGL